MSLLSLKQIKILIVFLWVSLIFLAWVVLAQSNPLPYQCWDTSIQWVIASSDIAQTQLSIQLIQDGLAKHSFMPVLWEDGGYEIPMNYDQITPWRYTIAIRATLDEVEDSREYEALISQTCQLCGNWLVEWDEQCEVDTDCWSQGVCASCSCEPNEELTAPLSILTPELIERIKQYALEAKAFFENSRTTITLPETFYNTGEDPTSRLEWVVKNVWQRFAYSHQWVYNDVPERTLGAETQTENLSFLDLYAQLPKKHKNAEWYLRFKWLFIPLLDAPQEAEEDKVLSLLNDWWVLAPQTENFDILWVVKMLYAHSVSYKKSPFAGVGAYLSVFSQQWDLVEIYVKTENDTYDKRTYSIRSKYQVEPSETKILESFSQEWLDLFSLITCKDGEVLWSTLGREIILFERVTNELGSFHQSIISLQNLPSAREARKKIDQYLSNKQLTDQEVANIVLALEAVEEQTQWNPLAAIATYGKYMAAYDAVYNDGVFNEES